ATLVIQDTGEGIDGSFLPCVFDRFRQGDGSTTRRHGGLGLGLSIVRQLVELHGGTVYAESPGTGLGSTFTIELPLRAPASARPSEREGDGGERPAPPAARPLESVRVLV